MRRSIPFAGALALAAPLFAFAEEPPVPDRELPRAEAPVNPAAAAAPAAPVIGTHQIDRFDAIDDLQNKLKANPKSLADWVILGELAHEVAIDAPANQAPRYFTMSRQAYEQALALSPNNNGLKAAVQFARDQEANGAAFEKSRDQATQTYLDARRRDLAATNYTPTLRVFTPPPQMPISPVSAQNGLAANATADPNPAFTNAKAATLATANMGTRQLYGTPVYQPYTLPQGTPYTFQQYSSSYYPPNYYGAGAAPVTIQRYNQSVNPLLNPLGNSPVSRPAVRAVVPPG